MYQSLHGRIMARGQRIHKLIPHASPAPSNKAIVAGGVGDQSYPAGPAKAHRTATPKKSFTRATPRGLFGNIGLMTTHS